MAVPFWGLRADAAIGPSLTRALRESPCDSSYKWRLPGRFARCYREVLRCLAAFGGSLQLAFRARSGGPVVALAQTDQGCGMVDFTTTGHQQLGLENNTSLDRQILAIASLPWKLP
jgi:hypothetical protein